jgi:tetratricopeptide (TPR) repeat protein
MTPASAMLLMLAAADDACRECHPAQTAAFRASPMGRSFAAAPTGASAQFEHALSGTKAAVRGREHTLTRAGLTAQHQAEYQIGSGSHARGFLLRLGSQLFQSPLAEYPRDRRWDLAPGYEAMTHPDFNRAVNAECLLCHTNGAGAAQPAAIGCERCHGPVAEHLRKPSKGTIVNPARLAAAERDAVCEQCHLAGEARIAHPGRGFATYQPGQRLEDHFSVYVFDRPRADLRVISHVEQLARSRCAPKLACANCHAPHGASIAVNTVCQSCHAEARAAGHPAGVDCAGCHMPKRRTSDGAHTAFTDHRIARRLEGNTIREAAQLKAWREPATPALRQRNLGLALIAVGERDRSTAQIQEGYRQLRVIFPKYERDAAVLASLGMVLFLKDQHKDAAQLLSAATREQPRDAATYEKLAAVYRATGDQARAVAALEQAIQLEPTRETAYHLLNEIRPESGALQRYLKVNPQSLLAREAVRRLTGFR